MDKFFKSAEKFLQDFWREAEPYVDKLFAWVKRQFHENEEKSLAVSTGLAAIVCLWVGGIVASAVMGALGLTVGILILAKYLPDSWKKKIAESQGLQALIDVGAFLIVVKILTGVTGLFAGIFSTVMVTAGIGLMAKSWKEIKIEEKQKQEPIN